jgi:hypothetical protein
MKSFARFLVQRHVAWMVFLVVVGLTALSGFYASRVVQDDDMLAFLPQGNPDVAAFNDVSQRFGSMDVALVGIESDDVFSQDFLTRLKHLTKRLNETEGLQYALSITSVEDFTPDPQAGGVSTDYLVREIPSDPAGLAALREKVMSRDHVVGNLVSSDGRGVMIYCFAVPGSQPRATAAHVKEAVVADFPSETKYWGGAPFVSTYIYDVTQTDLRRLAPWACAAIALIVLLSFRDLVGTGLALLSTIMGIVIPLGIMGALGVHTNIVLGSMPVILFALGSAYGVHLLSRFYALLPGRDRVDALRQALEDVGPSVLGSGLTTVFGTLSFVMMDIKPMRTFGIFTSIGLTIALALAMTFIPAVLVLIPLRGKPEATIPWLARMMGRLAAASSQKRWAFGIGCAALALGASFFTSRVDSRLDTTAFFDAGSPPAQADEFMRRHFGGSQFLQVEVEGDMNDPAVLREVQLLADRIAVRPGVSSVTHVGAIVAQTNEAMEDVRRIPDTTEKVRLLYAFLTGKRAVSQTITDDHRRALILVKLSVSRVAEVDEVLADVERIASEVPPVYAVAPASDPAASEHLAKTVAARIGALAVQLGEPVRDPQALVEALKGAPAEPPPAEIQKGLAAFVRSPAFGVPLGADAPSDAPDRIAAAIAALGSPPGDLAAKKEFDKRIAPAVAQILGKDVADPTVDDASLALEQSVGDIWVAARARAQSQRVIDASGLTLPADQKGERFQRLLGHTLLDLHAPGAVLPASAPGADDRTLKTLVTGLPVLYRGLSNSVFNNQFNSLWFALVLVIGLKALLFRNFWAGILSSIPTLLTLLVIYGGMGILGVHLDIGTSMLASLVIGAGDDYAVQYLWSWSVPEGVPLSKAAEGAGLETGPGIWTNAIMVAAGFFVLTLGNARPLKNVGGLTSIAMLAAALATFIICPLLARRRHYPPGPAPAALPGPPPGLLSIEPPEPDGAPVDRAGA